MTLLAAFEFLLTRLSLARSSEAPSLSLSLRCTEQQERFLSLSELYTHLAHFRRLEAGPLEHEDGAAGGGGRGGGLLLGRHGRGEAADHDLFCSLFRCGARAAESRQVLDLGVRKRSGEECAGEKRCCYEGEVCFLFFCFFSSFFFLRPLTLRSPRRFPLSRAKSLRAFLLPSSP